MRDKAVAMLTALGVAGAADDPLLDIVLNNVQWRIKNLSNLSEIPEGLESLAVSMAVGEYLNRRVKVAGSKKKGTLQIEFYGEEDLQNLLHDLHLR